MGLQVWFGSLILRPTSRIVWCFVAGNVIGVDHQSGQYMLQISIRYEPSVAPNAL